MNALKIVFFRILKRSRFLLLRRFFCFPVDDESQKHPSGLSLVLR